MREEDLIHLIQENVDAEEGVFVAITPSGKKLPRRFWK